VAVRGAETDICLGFGDAAGGANIDAVAAIFAFGRIDFIGFAIGGNRALHAFAFAGSALNTIVNSD